MSADEAMLYRAHLQEARSRSPLARNSQSPAPSQEDTSMHLTHPPPTSMRHIRASEAPSRSLLHPPEYGSESIALGSDEHKDAGDGWQEFKKGTALIFTVWYPPLSE